jgi:hypothetical protein
MFSILFKKALTRGSRAQMELFDEKNRRSKISWQGPFNLGCEIILLKFFLSRKWEKGAKEQNIGLTHAKAI